MSKLKFVFFFTVIIFSVNGYSQLNGFDLSKYKLPDLERRALETNFNISGGNYYEKVPNQTTDGYDETGTNIYRGDIYLNYNYYLNSIDYQKESNFGIKVNSDFSHRKENKEMTFKNSNISPIIYLQRDNRKYYNEKNFFETDILLNYQYDNNKIFQKNTFDDSESRDNLQTHTVLAYVPLKLGIGRIEQVQDARHAIYLFDELSKIERLSSGKSDEQIIEFARLISQLKNKRFFDFRIKRMAEIESVDSFLISHNYISKQDAKYFTTLTDFWDFGNRPLRNSGTRFSGALLPGNYFYYFNNPGDGIYFDAGKYNLYALLINGGIELKHEKPINLFWQNSIDFNCYAGIIEGWLNDKTNSVANEIRIPNIQIGFYHTIGFYPNTRTDMSFGYSVQYVQLFDKTDVESERLGLEGKGMKAGTDLSINYYISPKFRLNATSSFYYIWQDSKDEVIINFDNVVESNYRLSNFNSIPNGFYDYFKVNEIKNSFNISMIYSVF